jgi:hypothetical protein
VTMNRSRRVSAMCLLFATSANAFDVPLDGQSQMARRIYGTVLADLIVGDKMRISNLFTCVNDGSLMVNGAAPLEEKSEYRPEVIAEVVAGGEIAIRVSTAHMSEPSRQDAFLNLWPCQIDPMIQLYPVKSVNGFETLDGYLNSGFVADLPTP